MLSGKSCLEDKQLKKGGTVIPDQCKIKRPKYKMRKRNLSSVSLINKKKSENN